MICRGDACVARTGFWPFLILLFICVFTIFACGEKGDFAKARFSENLGRYPTALAQYESYWKLHSRDPRAPESIFRMGEIYRNVLGDFEKARKQYRNVVEWYPESPWAKKADIAIINCPDYFPFEAGVRTMGDSLSGGGNARTVEKHEPDSGDPRILQAKREVFAGDDKVSEIEFKYEKKGAELKETNKAGWPETVMLKFPAEKGKEWETVKDGKRMILRIESLNENLEVKAGTFTACLKVSEREAAPASPASLADKPAGGRPAFWKLQYFAPGKGLVLVSQGNEKKETRILELISLGKGSPRPK